MNIKGGGDPYTHGGGGNAPRDDRTKHWEQVMVREAAEATSWQLV